MRRPTIWLAVWIVASLTGSASAADCTAPSAWFSQAGVPPPSRAEPTRGSDCTFFQRAWQHFLYATEGSRTDPRFIGYTSYADLFGPDPAIGLLSKSMPATPSSKRAIVLAPRLAKAAHTADAEDILQAGSHSILIDQNGHPVFYSIVFNPTFTDWVETNRYNDLQTLVSVADDVEMPPGVAELKAAWTIVDDREVPDDRIVVEAQVPWLIADASAPGRLKVDTTRKLRTVSVALVGLHIAFATEGHPEMIWSTFEYDRNAPATVGNPLAPAPATSCPNPNEPRNETIVDDAKPYLLYRTGAASSDVNREPAAIGVVDAGAQVFSPATPIVRIFPFSSCFPGLNPKQAVGAVDPILTALDHSVRSQQTKKWLAHYRLIGAVWMSEPRNPNRELGFRAGEAFDDFQLRGQNRLSNTSMESFIQTRARNCFGCHDTDSKSPLGAKRIGISHAFRRFSLGAR